jgi:hypothetical protein
MQISRSPLVGQRRFAASSATAVTSRSCIQQRAATHICRASAVQSSPYLQQLINWAGSNKAVVDKVSTADDIATDQRVLVAAKDIAAGEQVLAVPDSAWITPATAQQSSIGKYIQGLEPWLQLALLLLSERAQPGGSSRMGPYLAAAADSSSMVMRSPLFWSEEELLLLQGTQLLESVRGYK